MCTSNMPRKSVHCNVRRLQTAQLSTKADTLSLSLSLCVCGTCSEEECSAACRMFNGRWYAQRQLSCQFCPVRKWRNAICGENPPLHAFTCTRIHPYTHTPIHPYTHTRIHPYTHICKCDLELPCSAGLYSQNRCPKGKHCNFLHVFRNPGGAFSRADRDLPALIPSPSRRGSRYISTRG